MNSVVGDKVGSVKGVGRCLSRPKEGTEEKVPCSESVVLSDDLAVDIGKPEEDREDRDTETSKDDGECDGGL